MTQPLKFTDEENKELHDWLEAVMRDVDTSMVMDVLLQKMLAMKGHEMWIARNTGNGSEIACLGLYESDPKKLCDGGRFSGYDRIHEFDSKLFPDLPAGQSQRCSLVQMGEK